MTRNSIVRRKFIAPGQYAKKVDTPSLRENRSLDLEKLRSSKGRERERSDLLRRQSKSDRLTRVNAQGRDPDAADWQDIEDKDNESISFSPDADARERYIELLNRPARDAKRRALVKKFGVEFSRIYTRYRRDAERRAGWSSSYYTPTDGERKYCEQAAVLCVLKGITPRQVLEYWDAEIVNFQGGRMKFPSLSLLKNPAIIDQVACSVLVSGGGRASGRLKRNSASAHSPKPIGGNSYTDLNGLDPKLRPALEDAGFETQQFNDRYLLSVQRIATALASGERVFTADGVVKQMAIWAAENLYASH